MKELRKDIFGYFDNPFQTEPAYDPGIDNSICLICCKKLSRPLKTISLMEWKDSKSYFYRVHKECYDPLTLEEIQEIEWAFIDGLKEVDNG